MKFPTNWLKGTVVPGAGRGRGLGFPTANLALANSDVLPPHGVYAGLVQLASQPVIRGAAIHVGPRPTFNELTPVMEVHIIDLLDQSLLGQFLKIRLIERLRGVEKFDTEQELIDRITKDCEKARQIVAKHYFAPAKLSAT